MKLRKSLILVFCLLSLGIMLGIKAEDQDHPIIKPIPGFVLDDSKFEDFSSYTFEHEQEGSWSEKQVKGKYNMGTPAHLGRFL